MLCALHHACASGDCVSTIDMRRPTSTALGTQKTKNMSLYDEVNAVVRLGGREDLLAQRNLQISVLQTKINAFVCLESTALGIQKTN